MYCIPCWQIVNTYLFVYIDNFLQMRFKKMFCICYRIAFMSVRLRNLPLLYLHEVNVTRGTVIFLNISEVSGCFTFLLIKLQRLHENNHRLKRVFSDPSSRDFPCSHTMVTNQDCDLSNSPVSSHPNLALNQQYLRYPLRTLFCVPLESIRISAIQEMPMRDFIFYELIREYMLCLSRKCFKSINSFHSLRNTKHFIRC